MDVTRSHLDRLIDIEAGVHYGQLPPPGVAAPFVVVRRPSPALLSAPHGARTFRDSRRETWHEEDEYTAGMALLLSELCGASVIATIWRTRDSDPNWHREETSPYKQASRRLAEDNGIRWLIDLHGMKETRLQPKQQVDLGTRKELRSLPPDHLDVFTRLIEAHLGTGSVSHNLFPAKTTGRTVTAFAHGALGVHAVQVEMKQSVRVAFRRADASYFAKEGPYAADPERVIAMLQALVDFVDYLHQLDHMTPERLNADAVTVARGRDGV